MQPFTNLIRLDRLPHDPEPPPRLGAFIWHFARQIKGLIALMACFEVVAAVALAMIPVLLGRLVNAIHEAGDARDILSQPWVWHLALPVLLIWTVAYIMHWYLCDMVYVPRFGNMMRFQLGHYTLGQSMSYFMNDYAGRIANKVLESGPALRDPITSALRCVLFASVFVVTCLTMMLKSDVRLAIPPLVWLAGYIVTLIVLVPQVKKLSRAHSDNHSTLVGRVVDSYTNILSVKLFGRERFEDTLILNTLARHSDSMLRVTARITLMGSVHMLLNLAMMLATPIVAIHLWQDGAISAGAVAMALPMVWQMTNQSGWIRQEITKIFEDLGRVEDCLQTIAKPYTVVDAMDATDLKVSPGGGTVRFETIRFHYGRRVAEDGEGGVIHDLNLVIPAGQRVGLVGRSGAGKSTLVNLLLRFFDVESGRVTIDGQDIAHVTQESLRHHIAMVTQESSLLHRSIMDNIRYGRPEASDDEVFAAARRAHAHDFILGLEDKRGRKGYAAMVGERGVKLSGGQRQRIAIARVILENAPILILDEATSALDSEVEAAIQEEMATLMQGKTVIAIAHRLSTIAQMQRLVVLDHGRVVEDGDHATLLARGGLYAQLWQRQSGGFLGE